MRRGDKLIEETIHANKGQQFSQTRVTLLQIKRLSFWMLQLETDKDRLHMEPSLALMLALICAHLQESKKGNKERNKKVVRTSASGEIRTREAKFK